MTATAFREELLSVMDRKNHWAWSHFVRPGISRDQLKIHFRQEFEVYVRDFPLFLARIYAKNPPIEVRFDLAENLYEEETGRISGMGPHPSLFLKMMEGLGFKRSEFEAIELYPEARDYREWLDEITVNGAWYEAAAVTAIFVEGSVKDRKELENSRAPLKSEEIEQVIVDHPLVKYQGVPRENMDLVRAHLRVEGGHRKAAWKMVLDHTDSPAKQERVKSRLIRTLDLWIAYRDRVAAECRLKRGV